MTNKYLAVFLENRGLKTSYAEAILYGGRKTGGEELPIESTSTEEPPNEEPPIESTTSTTTTTEEPTTNKPSMKTQLYDAAVKPVFNIGKARTLEEKIVKMIQNALLFNAKITNVNEMNKADHEKQVKEDIEKIKKLVVPKQIDMLYGGGFLMFDSKFNIKQMIYTCYKDGKNPVFSSEPVNPNTENNAINKIINSNMTKYKSSQISGEILKIIPTL